MVDSIIRIHENFLTQTRNGNFPQPRSEIDFDTSGLSSDWLFTTFHAQVQCRHLDRYARILQAKGQGFYTIGSSGHEGNAAIALAFRHTDPAFLHYRGAAFMVARSTQLPEQTPIWDILLSLVSSSDDPISGGRHKVLGSKSLNIPPQTSTIASHLPKSVGVAYSIGLSSRVTPITSEWPKDSVVLCSFGDASLNHSTAQGALNTAAWTAYQNVPLPIIFLCEDNQIGISTKTPPNWVESSMKHRQSIKYVSCDGLDVIDTHLRAEELVNWVRTHRKPAFLHMKCVRLGGHAGSDVQETYLSQKEITKLEADDPLLHTARYLIEETKFTTKDILELYQTTDSQIAKLADEAILRPKLTSAPEVMASILPVPRLLPKTRTPNLKQRNKVFGTADIRSIKQPAHMAKLLNFALTDLMLEHGEIVLVGEDIAKKGGVYGVTKKLFERFGANRVLNSILDEQSILGLAIGLGQNGFTPIPEIQFLAYLHNAEDQIRGEASTLSFFSNQQYTNPMVIRIAGLAYQKGFGGHFHNDNSLAVLRDIPGLIIGCPSNGQDAALMLKEAVRLAREEQRIVVFLEPIALYMTTDLYEKGDNKWASLYPDLNSSIDIKLGQISIHGTGNDLALISYGNGYYLSRQAEKILFEKWKINARVIDLRWLSPLAENEILASVKKCSKVLIVDECRKTGSLSEALISLFHERGNHSVARITAHDSFIPTGPSYSVTLPSVNDIVTTSLKLINENTT